MKKQIQESELELFLGEMQDVSRLTLETAEPYRQKPPPRPRPREPALPDEDGVAGLSESEIETPEYLLFARPGIQRRLLADLQRGAIEVGLEVDMHGLQSEHARQLLGEFLAECRHRRVRCARIIHGKGHRSSGRQPVLKGKINYWLRLYDQVLAFCSTPQRDGGTGAVYVLLRNPDKGNKGAGRR
ncbi:Smr protein/MutS2 [Thiorhodococcus drewsii AZ1]|uniref:Smr protein/MutS2 n=1 Tax=Thiorhodococcus drewsii AZ1 TaxID=765913 RepID=G2E2Z0_9GAMM|nr:Smr/MutS family protein [Thiorhodococcus drewsii]EGV30452.1 Smr protein/MutS2 [Thiorhodococcus drewsii AZ1]